MPARIPAAFAKTIHVGPGMMGMAAVAVQVVKVFKHSLRVLNQKPRSLEIETLL